MAKESVKLDLRSDGVYLIVDNSDESKRASEKDIFEVIGEHKIERVNFDVVGDILKSSEPIIRVKISDVASVAVKKESISIETSKDRMEASIRFIPPEFGGGIMTKFDVIDDLKQNGISHGIDEKEIEHIVNRGPAKDYVNPRVIARGTPPVSGKDGSVVYNVDMSGKKNQPKILADGSVDFKQIDYFQSVKSGDIIAYRISPTEGEAGTDVFGYPVQQKTGKHAPKFSKSKNVYISDDEMELVAQVSGQIVVSGKNISISNTLDIKGDVGYETGNIDFDGSVTVRGAVLAGFVVEATGNIEVKGVVEAATLKAAGSINLYGGIQGRFKGSVEAGGNVFLKYAQNSVIVAGGNLVSNALLHCNVNVSGSVLLEGSNCFIAGGNVNAGDEIRAKTIGSHMGTRTEIKIGGNPEVSNRYEKVKNEYEQVKQQYKKLSDDYEKIVKSGDIARLDAKRKHLLLQLIQNRNQLRDTAQQMETELQDLVASLRVTRGWVIAEKVAYHGVSISISNAILELHDDITHSVFKNVGGHVKAEAYV